MLSVGLQQRQTDAGVVDDTAATLGGGGQNAPLGGHHRSAGVDGGVVAGVDAFTVAAAQRHRLAHLGVGMGC